MIVSEQVLDLKKVFRFEHVVLLLVLLSKKARDGASQHSTQQRLRQFAKRRQREYDCIALLAHAHLLEGAISLAFEICLIAGKQNGVAEQGLAQIGVVAFEGGEQFMENTVALVNEIVVGFIMARLPASLRAIHHRLGMRDSEQRTCKVVGARSHAG